MSILPFIWQLDMVNLKKAEVPAAVIGLHWPVVPFALLEVLVHATSVKALISSVAL